MCLVGAALQVPDAGAGRPSLLAQMIEDSAPHLLEPGTQRETVVKMIGDAPPSALFPGWDAAYNLGAKGISFCPRNDWLLVRYKNGFVAEWTIAREPRR
jgi:hypothetical protein